MSYPRSRVSNTPEAVEAFLLAVVKASQSNQVSISRKDLAFALRMSVRSVQRANHILSESGRWTVEVGTGLNETAYRYIGA